MISMDMIVQHWAAALICVALPLVFWLLTYCFRRHRRQSLDLIVRDAKQGHHWVIVDSFDYGQFCSVCETGVFDGVHCDCCGVQVDEGCIGAADRKLACKPLSVINPEENEQSEKPTSTKHHWVNGNLTHGCICAVCDELCGEGPGLKDWRCAWCQHTVHDECRPGYSDVCSFGKMRRVVVPPHCIKLKTIGWRGRKQLVIKEVNSPAGIDDWSPVVVIANKLSGNGEGSLVLQKFRLVLNPCQVIDLSKSSPENCLGWCNLLKDVQCRILIAGGDGTVGWILSTIEKLKLEPPPLVGLLPLGTGNDLSRILGYGSGHSGDIDPIEILERISAATPVKLDRWQVRIDAGKQSGGGLFAYGGRCERRHMSNYLSVGVDAAVTYNFHHRRARLPDGISSRLVNKLLFFHYGTRDLVERACHRLDTGIELYMDGVRQELPELEGIVILNIPYWGAGVTPWQLGGGTPNGQPQRIDDGLLEVMGLYSSFHIAQMQVGLSEPYRFGQASEVCLKLRRTNLPVQVDGEPWKQSVPCDVSLSRSGQASMLAVLSRHAHTQPH